ncbi:MAG: DUF2341 domain-containing protein [Chloroflexota bacterium]|nr:DUF2341 domain-containing protein [Chloroflexota bacterium]
MSSKFFKIGVAMIFPLALAAGLVVGVLRPDTLSGYTWWDSAWTRSAEIVIQENTDSDLDNFQVKVVVPYDSDMRADFGDIRFVGDDNTTVLSYWIEDYQEAESATFWVRIPSLAAQGTKSIKMYYGNSEASNSSDIHNTFIWGDDFEDVEWTLSNVNQVNYHGADQYMENGEYYQRGAGADEPICEIYENGELKVFPDNYIAEVMVKPLKGGAAHINPRYVTVSNKYECMLDAQWGNVLLAKVVDDAWTKISLTQLPTKVELNSWYKLTSVVTKEDNTNRMRVYINDIMYLDATDSDLMYPGLAFLTYDWNNDFHAGYDDFRVREYVSQEPTVSIGVEELPQ